MSSPSTSGTADCGCCEGVTPVTPVTIQNAPGLSSISYRVGTQTQFKETMIANLTKYPALVSLTTRSDTDLAIDLLDAWAMVADVLTFYQERIANEGYLRTAKERVSVLQLAREIGYELSPGVAASAYLAFTLDTSGSISQTTINSGARVQSVPIAGQTPPQMPQTFETVESIVAYPQFNALQPRLTRAQMYSDITSFNSTDNLNHVYFAGTSTKLSPGDKLLFVSVSGSTPLGLRTVLTVTPNAPSPGQTDVALAADPSDQSLSKISPSSPSIQTNGPPWPQNLSELTPADLEGIAYAYPGQSDLVSFLTQKGWSYLDFASLVNSFAGSLNASASDVQVFAMRMKTAIFGSTAPNWYTLPPSVISPSPSTITTSTGRTIPLPGFPYNWDDPSSHFPINENSQEENYSEDGSTIYLSSSNPAIAANGWVVLRDQTIQATTRAYQVSQVWEESMADFLVSAKVTGIALNLGGFALVSDAFLTSRVDFAVLTTVYIPDWIFPINPGSVALAYFTLRGTTVYAQSEQLALADLPDTNPVKGDQITLGNVVAGLQVGQAIAVTGQLLNQPGQEESEIVTITDVAPYASGSPFTTITVESLYDPSKGLANCYERASVTINANVALATNGSTISGEVLGSGDPSQPYLTFNLKQDPLTFIPSPTSPTGAQTTLQVWVSNGSTNILWNQAPSLLGLAANSQSYAVRIQDDSSVTVLFGNARPPVGSENITATYRVGIGSSGMVQANQLTQLASRPLGLKSVTNPLPASGAADPQDINGARENAPLEVLTMGRIASLSDCQNFALSFQGIGKAVAISAWAGETQYVRLIVASAMQGQVAQPLLGYLQTAISNFADPAIQVVVESYDQLTFNIGGWIMTASDQEQSAVLEDVLAALRAAFSFGAMDFGQPVYLSDVISIIQGVEGVVATNVTSLYLSSAPAGVNDSLTCEVDQLLTLNPDAQGVNLNPVNPQS